MSNTVKEIEDLLVTKITALESSPGVAYFADVINMTAAEFILNEVSTFPVAAVSFSSELVTDVISRMIINETYEVLIITKKTGNDTSRLPHVLCDAVRDGIHGKDFDEEDIGPFRYLGRSRESGIDGQNIVYSLKFETTHYYHIPTTS